MIFPTYLEQFKEFVFKNRNKKKLNESETNLNEDLNNLHISCENNNSENEDKSIIYEEIKDVKRTDLPSSSNCLFTRSFVTFKSANSETPNKWKNQSNQFNPFNNSINHECIESKGVVKTKFNQSQLSEKEQKCIHRIHPECLNLSNLEDGSCLVCNALALGSEYEIKSSFRNEIKRFNDNRDPTNELSNDIISKLNDSVSKEENKSKSLLNELNNLTKMGWYWGKLSRFEAEDKLINEEPGTFLIRDSFDANYILSLSFKIVDGVFHTRIEYSSGLFHFYLHPNKTYETVSSLVDDLILNSQTGIYYYVKSKKTGQEIRFTIKLDKPLSRFKKVNNLRYLCRFVIKQHIRYDLIHKLPVPDSIKFYLEENHF